MRISLFLTLFLLISVPIFAQKGDYVFRLGMFNNTPILQMTTTKTFTCSNYGIYIRQGWSRDTLTVNIIGIDSRQRCNNVPDKARETVEVYGIQESEFVLRIQREEQANFFQVQFDGESFSVTPVHSDFIRSITN